MTDRRYYAFISTSGTDMQDEYAVLTQALLEQGIFSWSPAQSRMYELDFVRKQIDQCDYYILLLGNHYGRLDGSGASFMHLEYIHAITKQKPIIAIRHHWPDLNTPTVLDDPEARSPFGKFRRQVQERKQATFFLAYDDASNLSTAIKRHVPRCVNLYPTTGWVRANARQSTLNVSSDTLALQEEVIQLRKKLALIDRRVKETPALNPILPAIMKTMPAPVSHEAETLNFAFTVQAYQEGNFKELKLNKTMRWDEILTILGPSFHPPAPEDQFGRVINDYLNSSALSLAREQMPRAHAIARAQINTQSLHQIKTQMKNNHWIAPISRDERKRLLWELTEEGNQILQKSFTSMPR